MPSSRGGRATTARGGPGAISEGDGRSRLMRTIDLPPLPNELSAGDRRNDQDHAAGAAEKTLEGRLSASTAGARKGPAMTIEARDIDHLNAFHGLDPQRTGHRAAAARLHPDAGRRRAALRLPPAGRRFDMPNCVELLEGEQRPGHCRSMSPSSTARHARTAGGRRRLRHRGRDDDRPHRGPPATGSAGACTQTHDSPRGARMDRPSQWPRWA